MKISILGNIIDTENIYQITEISHYANHPSKFQKWHYGEVEEEYYWCRVYYNKNSFISICNNTLDKVTKVREEVIKYWSNNQSQIPKIEFI